MTEPTAPTEPPSTNATGGWRHPRDRGRTNHFPSMIAGVALILIGAWYFLDHTLGIRLPRVAWGQLWPVLLIVIGVLVLLRASGRRS